MSTPPLFSALAAGPPAPRVEARPTAAEATTPAPPPTPNPQEKVEVSAATPPTAEEMLEKAQVVDPAMLADAQFQTALKAAVSTSGSVLLMVVPDAAEHAAPGHEQPATAAPEQPVRGEVPQTMYVEPEHIVPTPQVDPTAGPPDHGSELYEALAAKNLIFDARQPISVGLQDGVGVGSGEHVTHVGFGVRFHLGGANGFYDCAPAEGNGHVQRVNRELFKTGEQEASYVFYFRPTKPGVQMLRFQTVDQSGNQGAVSIPVVVKG